MFVNNAQNAIKTILDDDLINVLNTIIIPRLNEVNETTMLISENAQSNVNLDEVLMVLDIKINQKKIRLVEIVCGKRNIKVN